MWDKNKAWFRCPGDPEHDCGHLCKTCIHTTSPPVEGERLREEPWMEEVGCYFYDGPMPEATEEEKEKENVDQR